MAKATADPTQLVVAANAAYERGLAQERALNERRIQVLSTFAQDFEVDTTLRFNFHDAQSGSAFGELIGRVKRLAGGAEDVPED